MLKNGRMAASALLQACSSHSNFTLLLEHSVESFELCQSTGSMLAVKTNQRRCVLHYMLIMKESFSGWKS